MCRRADVTGGDWWGLVALFCLPSFLYISIFDFLLYSFEVLKNLVHTSPHPPTFFCNHGIKRGLV